MEGEMNMGQQPADKSTGSIVGAIIIVIILILGGFYFWGQKLNDQTPTDEMATTTEEMAVTGDVTDIEADLDAAGSEVEGLDVEVTQ